MNTENLSDLDIKKKILGYATVAHGILKLGRQTIKPFQKFLEDGMPDQERSSEAAVYDSVIYYCWINLKESISIESFIWVFHPSPLRLLKIIGDYPLRRKDERAYPYHKRCAKELGFDKIETIPTPHPEIGPLKLTGRELADLIFEYLFKKTGCTESGIVSKRRIWELVTCRTAFINVFYVFCEDTKVSQKTIGSFIRVGHSTIIHHKQKHDNYMVSPVSKDPKVQYYHEVFNYVVDAIRIVQHSRDDTLNSIESRQSVASSI